MLKVGQYFLVNDTKIILRFRFERTTFTWALKSIEYGNEGSAILLTPRSPIGTQKGLSYFSEGPVIFSNNSIVLKFNDKFQVGYILKLILLNLYYFNLFSYYLIENNLLFELEPNQTIQFNQT